MIISFMVNCSISVSINPAVEVLCHLRCVAGDSDSIHVRAHDGQTHPHSQPQLEGVRVQRSVGR